LSLYREFGSTQSLGIMELFGEMGRLHAEFRANAESHDHGHSHAH
jgi:hypothetical protein